MTDKIRQAELAVIEAAQNLSDFRDIDAVKVAVRDLRAAQQEQSFQEAKEL